MSRAGAVAGPQDLAGAQDADSRAAPLQPAAGRVRECAERRSILVLILALDLRAAKIASLWALRAAAILIAV
jgi:hypothetical protein